MTVMQVSLQADREKLFSLAGPARRVPVPGLPTKRRVRWVRSQRAKPAVIRAVHLSNQTER